VPSIVFRNAPTFPLFQALGTWPSRDFVPPHDGWSNLVGFWRDLEVEDAAGEFRVSLALPGYQPQDVEVRTEGQVLSIVAMRRRAHAYGGSVEHVRRALTLPAGLDTTRAEATLRHGLLTVVFSKAPVVSSHAIPVRAGWEETSRPVRSLDLGVLPREEGRRPGFWQRVKEWLVGPRRSAV
jgi:HSP20 family molecular chaperone IbpA